MVQERIEQAGHGYVEALGPLVELTDMLISDLWLVHIPLLSSPASTEKTFLVASGAPRTAVALPNAFKKFTELQGSGKPRRRFE